jgi:hypothetical protein
MPYARVFEITQKPYSFLHLVFRVSLVVPGVWADHGFRARTFQSASVFSGIDSGHAGAARLVLHVG